MKKCTHIVLLLLTFWIVFDSTAQPTLDTIKDCLKQKPHFFAKLDSRNSFIENSRAKIFGIKFGIKYGNRLHFGIGYNQLYGSSENFEKVIHYTDNNFPKSSTGKLRLFYFSLHAEYVFYQTKHWELSMPLQIGLGQTCYKYSYAGEKHRAEKNINFIYEPAVSIEYKFVKWFGVGFDLGVRVMITSDRKLNNNFNAPTYAFKLLLYYSEIYKSLFPNGKLLNKL